MVKKVIVGYDDQMAHHTIIGLVQISTAFEGAVYFPYSIGLLEAYYRKYGQNTTKTVFLEPVFDRCPPDMACERLHEADLVGFSVYAWNLQISLAIARQLKARKPQVLIVFGGPQIPRDTRKFLCDFPFIDLVCQGEGERTFTTVIDALGSRSWEDIPSISYRHGNNLYTNPGFDRLADLDQIPSPYLSGIFDRLLKKYCDRQWLALWETNRGCPFSCAFCDWGAPEQRKMHHFSTERAKAELQWFSDHKLEFVFCCDSNFGLFERDVELAAFAAELSGRTGYPKALSVQNAKNTTDRIIRVQEALERGGLNKGVTLALQSATEEVLDNIQRKNIPFASFARLQRYFTEHKIVTYTDIILGLPSETYQSFLNSIDRIIDGGQYNRVQFGNLSLLPNSRIADPIYIEKYGLHFVESDCVNAHGGRRSAEEIAEIQHLVVGTKAMPPVDWRRARAWSWMCSFLFYDKFLQLPLALASKIKKIPVTKLVEKFLDTSSGFPRIQEIAEFYLDGAKTIQQGGPEFFLSETYSSIYWPYDEYTLIELAATDRLTVVYEESLNLLKVVLNLPPDDDFSPLLEDAARLNQAMMKMPDDVDDLEVRCDYDLWSFFQSILIDGVNEAPQKSKTVYVIKRQPYWEGFDDWMRKVIWYGNKKADYWWPVEVVR